MAQAQLANKDTGLVKGLGLMDATTLVMGSMIGSGIFIVAADIARQVQSPGLLMMTWIVTAVLTMIAALSYGELAAAMPHAGGQYVYLREAFGPLWRIPLRLDAVPGDSDRHDCRGGGGVRQVHGRLLALRSPPNNWLARPVRLTTQQLLAIADSRASDLGEHAAASGPGRSCRTCSHSPRRRRCSD